MPADEINQGEHNGTRKNAWKIITKTEATPQLNLTWPSNQFAEASLNTVKELKQISMHHVNLSNEFAIVPKNSAAKKGCFDVLSNFLLIGYCFYPEMRPFSPAILHDKSKTLYVACYLLVNIQVEYE